MPPVGRGNFRIGARAALEHFPANSRSGRKRRGVTDGIGTAPVSRNPVQVSLANSNSSFSILSTFRKSKKLIVQAKDLLLKRIGRVKKRSFFLDRPPSLSKPNTSKATFKNTEATQKPSKQSPLKQGLQTLAVGGASPVFIGMTFMSIWNFFRRGKSEAPQGEKVEPSPSKPTESKVEKPTEEVEITPAKIAELKKLSPKEQRKAMAALSLEEQRKLFIFEGLGEEIFEPVQKEQIRGIDHVIKELDEYIYDLQNFKELRSLFQPNPKIPVGVLFNGPPGTGKTFSARWIATASGARKLNANNFPGLSEEGFTKSDVKEFFFLLRGYIKKTGQPIVVYWDEFDNIAKDRTKLRDSKKIEALTELTLQLDGPYGRPDGVFIIGITNNPVEIDKALTRPGRIGRNYYFGYPDRPGKRDIFKSEVEKYPHQEGMDFEDLSYYFPERSTAADIKDQVEFAWSKAVREAHRKGEKDPRLDFSFLRMRLFQHFLGPKVKSKLNPREVIESAVHEWGHALVALEKGFRVKFLTVIPSTSARYGSAHTLLDKEIISLQDSLDKITNKFGGKFAQKISGIPADHGEGSDVEGASEQATHLVEHFGLGEKAKGFPIRGVFEQRMAWQTNNHNPFSDATLREVEMDARKIYEEQAAEAYQILKKYPPEAIKWLAERLVERKVIFEEEIPPLIKEAQQRFGYQLELPGLGKKVSKGPE